MNKELFREDIQNIPEGKIRDSFNSKAINGIQAYLKDDNIEVGEIIDVFDVVQENPDILISSNSFLQQLKLFPAKSLLNDLTLNGIDLNRLSIKKLRELLEKRYEIPIYEIAEEIEARSERITPFSKLHPFQNRIKAKVLKGIFSLKEKAMLVHLPTGAGKTRTACEIIIDIYRSSSILSLHTPVNVLWLAQSEELCTQARQTFEHLYRQKGEREISVHSFHGSKIFNEDDLSSENIFFCGLPKLMTNYQNSLWKNVGNKITVVFIDEAHRSIANKWGACVKYFTKMPGVITIGLTATPGRSVDEENIILSDLFKNKRVSLMDEHFQEIDHPISYLIQSRFLAEVERNSIDTNVDLFDSKEQVEEFKIKGLKALTADKLANHPLRNRLIIKLLKMEAEKSRKILVFSCSTAHNLILQYLLKKEGIQSHIIDGSTEAAKRESIITEFKNSEGSSVLINFGVLSTGFDAPRTNTCLICRPINSLILYSQMVGRVLRGTIKWRE